MCARSQQIMLPVHCLPEASCHVLLVVIFGGDVQFTTVSVCVLKKEFRNPDHFLDFNVLKSKS